MENNEQFERMQAADEFEAIAYKLSSIHPKSRLLSLVLTKLEEAALWYAKLLREEDKDGTK